MKWMLSFLLLCFFSLHIPVKGGGETRKAPLDVECFNSYKKLILVRDLYKKGKTQEARDIWEKVCLSNCWQSNTCLQWYGAVEILELVDNQKSRIALDLDYFWDPEVVDFLIEGLFESKCYFLLLGDGLVLVDRCSGRKRADFVKRLYTEFSKGHISYYMPSSHFPSSLYVSHLIGVYPYRNAGDDLWKIYEDNKEEWIRGDIVMSLIAVCFKQRRPLPFERLEEIIKEDKRNRFLTEILLSYLYEISKPKTVARKLIQENRPDISEETFSKKTRKTLAKWVSSNFSAIEMH